jgi:replicative DNA helicase
MSAEQLWGRMACPAAGVEWRNVRAGRIDNAQFSNLEAQSISLSQSYGDNLIIAENALTIFAIQRIAADTRPDIVIIDQLPEIIWHDPDEKEVSWYGKACRYFRNMIAKRLNVPVILIHQLNRAVEERQNKRPVLADLRWSGEIEQRADVVLMCYREDYYDDGSNPITRVPFELWTRKHRQGVKDSLVILEYDLKDQWFY